MKIAIVEDRREHADLLVSYLEAWAQKSGQEIWVKCYPDAEAFWFAWEEEKDFSALFLDIQMGGMNGMELARRVRRENRTAQIIFTTGISDYMQEGYEVAALHYLLKPIDRQKVEQCMDRICEREKRERPCLCLRFDTGTERVSLADIWWLGALRHNTLVCTQDGDGQFRRREAQNSMGELEKELDSADAFIRCHRSYLVNLAHVRRIEKTDVVMDNQDRVPLSRRLYHGVNEDFIRYYTGGRT